MTAEQTADFYGLDLVAHSSPWGAFRIRAQRRANDTGQTVHILTSEGVSVCSVDPIEEDGPNE